MLIASLHAGARNMLAQQQQQKEPNNLAEWRDKFVPDSYITRISGTTKATTTATATAATTNGGIESRNWIRFRIINGECVRRVLTAQRESTTKRKRKKEKPIQNDFLFARVLRCILTHRSYGEKQFNTHTTALFLFLSFSRRHRRHIKSAPHYLSQLVL